MDMQNLIKMANRIGDFFESAADRSEVENGIADHLKKFWAPRMRLQLLEYIDREHGAGLKEIVITSILAHREKLASNG